VIGPYDVYLADQSPAYRKAWGEFVIAQLEQRQCELRGMTIEVHAGSAYVEPLRAPLARRGAALTVPLPHLRQGEQLAWYKTRPGQGQVCMPSPPMAAEAADRAAGLAALLSDPQQGLRPGIFSRSGQAACRSPACTPGGSTMMAQLTYRADSACR
jgi:hypothetical protein